MEPDDYGIEDNQPLPQRLGKEYKPAQPVSPVTDDAPLPAIQGGSTLSGIDPPSSVKDLTQSNSQAPNPHNGNGSVSKDTAVSGYFNLYKWHPFTELFCAMAEWFEPETHDILQREAFAKKHPKYFNIAIFADFALLALVVVGILAAIVYVALRAIGVDFELDVVRIPIYWPQFGPAES